MRLDTKMFARGVLLEVRQEGNRLAVASRAANSSSLTYEVVINVGEEASTVRGRDEVGEPVDYLVAVGPTGVIVSDELQPGKTVTYAAPQNYSLQSREAQQSLAVNVISSLIGVPLAFDPSQS